jgi:hypothetical protein
LRWGEVLKRSFSLKRLKNSLADPQKEIGQANGSEAGKQADEVIKIQQN